MTITNLSPSPTLSHPRHNVLACRCVQRVWWSSLRRVHRTHHTYVLFGMNRGADHVQPPEVFGRGASCGDRPDMRHFERCAACLPDCTAFVRRRVVVKCRCRCRCFAPPTLTFVMFHATGFARGVCVKHGPRLLPRYVFGAHLVVLLS